MNCVFHPERTAAAYCRTCGRALCEECRRDVRGVIYCEDCLAARVSDTMPAAVPGAPAGAVVQPPGLPSPGLAAVLGFIPGVGAMYNGQFLKGIVHVLVFATLIALADRSEFFGVLIPFWIFYMVFDAYATAKARISGGALPDPFGLNRLGGPSGAIDVPGGVPVGAVVLIGLGVLFLLDNMGVNAFRWLGDFWPVILIAIGVWMMARRSSAQSQPQAPSTPPPAPDNQEVFRG